jgi:mono/diheme cytochrome c family protein
VRAPARRCSASTGGRTALLLVLALVVAGCGSARRSEPVLGRPLPLGELAAQGQVVFMTHCHSCHPAGEAGLAPALNDKPLPDFLKRFQVRQGMGVMPSFSRDQISDEQLDALVEYLRVLRRGPRGDTGRRGSS